MNGTPCGTDEQGHTTTWDPVRRLMPSRRAAHATTTLLFVLGWAAARPVLAQRVDLGGHVVAAAGVYSNPFASGMLVGVAAGLESRLAGHLAIGGEAGAIAGGGDLMLQFAVDGAVYLSDATTGKYGPFVAAGYTRLAILTDQGQSNLWHVRVGLNAWRGPSKGIRVELVEQRRRHAWTDWYTLLRIGVIHR